MFKNVVGAWRVLAPDEHGGHLFCHTLRLFGDLSRCAWETVEDLYGAGLDVRHAVPGMVVSIHASNLPSIPYVQERGKTKDGMIRVLVSGAATARRDALLTRITQIRQARRYLE